MPTIDDGRKLFLYKLGSVLKTEKTIEKMLPKLAKEAQTPQLAQGFERHLEDTRRHIRNIEHAFEALGQKPKTQKAPAIEGLKETHDEFMRTQKPSPEIVDAFLTGAAADVEHHEISAYSSLVTMAHTLGEEDVVTLLEENLEQEQRMLREIEATAQQVSRRLAGVPA